MTKNQTRTLVLDGRDLVWLAGLIEGDGCFSGLNVGSPTISIQMIDEDTISRVAKLFGVRYTSSEQRGCRTLYRTQVRGPWAITWMKVLAPHMGWRRSQRIGELLAQYKERPTRHVDRLEGVDWSQYKHLSWREIGRLHGISHEMARRLACGLDRSGKPMQVIKEPRHRAIEVRGETPELDWMAGYLEAEGSFMKGPPSNPNCPIISLQTTDFDVAKKCSALVNRCVSSYMPKGGAYKLVYLVSVRGRPAMRWMKALYPLMSCRRQGQISAALASYDSSIRAKFIDSQKKLSDTHVLAIPALLEQGNSIRSIARMNGVHHETVRSAIENRLPRLLALQSAEGSPMV